MSGGNVLAGDLAGDCVRGTYTGHRWGQSGTDWQKTARRPEQTTQTRTIHRKEKS